MKRNQKKIAVFLDRDGTINEDVGYINHPSRFRLLPNSAKAINQLNRLGLRVIIVTNQSGVARGYFDESLVITVNEKMETLLAREDAAIDSIYYCPHHPSEGENGYRFDCDCRKPKPGMIKRAVKEFDIDLNRSFMVGDKITDIEFGKQLNLHSIMVMTGYGLGEYENHKENWTIQPDNIVSDLLEAVKVIKSRI